jgi:mannose-6-phosphate isomerase-like protein (cupin superfamily)
MNQIDFLKSRYEGVRVGFSTHESPDTTIPVMMAVAKGVNLFEKHVGLRTDQYPLNAYSAAPGQVRQWLESARTAYQICGDNSRYQPDEKELTSVLSLRRGVFAKRDIQPGEILCLEDVDFAFPCVEGQLTANDWSIFSTFTAGQKISGCGSIMTSDLEIADNKKKLLDIASQVNNLLTRYNVVVPEKIKLEISHHYGLDRFSEYGLAMLTVVNRHYCKKVIIVLPGQNHPEQYHKCKEETFHILGGDMILKLDGETRHCSPGDLITIMPGVRHEFSTQNGLVFEEISSTHFVDDSYYTDEAVTNNKSRKTMLTYWREQPKSEVPVPANADQTVRRAA